MPSETHSLIDSKSDEALRLLPGLLAARERMLLEVGRVLHDSVAQDLSAMALICEHLAETGGEHKRELMDVQEGAQRCVEELRRLCATISPATEEKDFLSLLRDFLHSLSAKGRCKGTLRSSLRILPMPHAIAMPLYGSIRRIVNIALRQGKATEVSIGISGGDRSWELRLRDNSGAIEKVETAMQSERPWVEACALLLDAEAEFPQGEHTRLILRRGIPEK